MSRTNRETSTTKIVCLLSLLLMLLVASPAVPLTLAGAQRVIHPQLSVQTDLNEAEILFAFEEILLSKGFRVTRHVYRDAQETSFVEIMEYGMQEQRPPVRGDQYIFEFEVTPNLVGEMVLRYQIEPKILLFETARFEEDYPAMPMNETRLRLITDRLLNGIIQEIERRLR